MVARKRYRGLVKNVRNDEGNIRVDVQRMDSHGRMQSNLLVETLHPGLMFIPEEGWLVACRRGDDGEHYVESVICGSEIKNEDAVKYGFRKEEPENENDVWNITEDFEPGTFIFQLDRQSGIKYTWNEEMETYDLTIRAGGDLTFEAGGTIDEDTGTEYTEPDEFTQEDE